MVLAAIAMAQALYSEPLRPLFHFTAQKGWLNDPNGLVYADGEYHLFFQHNPFGTEWGNMTWGHAVSKDLVHWKQIANAIEPDERGTIYSGSAVTDPENTSALGADIVALYTSAGGNNEASKGQPFTQSLAYSKDKGRTFVKLPKPVIAHIEAENRDPKVAWHAASRSWVLALYLNREEFALFTSKNLRDWTLTQKLVMPGAAECPDFFEMPIMGTKQRKWVFTGANGLYRIGTFDGKQFHPETATQQVEFGGNNYAVQTYYGLPKDRHVQIGWMRGGNYPGMPFNQQMTFPCDLTLRKTKDGLRLYRYPAPEIDKIYATTFDASSGIAPGWPAMDLEAKFAAGTKPTILDVNGQSITYDPIAKTLTALNHSAVLEPENGWIHLRVLVDRNSLEVFGNGGRVSLSSCMNLPSRMELQLKPAVSENAQCTARRLRTIWD